MADGRTCSMPVVSLIAWKERVGKFIFCRVPNERGRYLRTDVSVAFVACPHCNATIGEPCRRHRNEPFGYHGATHTKRRQEWTHVRKALMRDGKWEMEKDVIDHADGANIRITGEKTP